MGEMTKLGDAVMPSLTELAKQAQADPDAFAAKYPQPEPDPIPAIDRIRALRDTLVPTRFHGATFVTYQAKTPSQQSALRAVQSWVGYAQKGQPAMLALIGKQGTGKSHLLYAAVNFLLNTGLDGSALYVRPWYRLADELRYGDGASAEKDYAIASAAQVRARLWEKRVAFLDEVRATASTSFDDTELAKYACHAYDRSLAVMITTNVHPLSDVMGPAAASRFTQIVVDGPDARQEKVTGRDRAAGSDR